MCDCCGKGQTHLHGIDHVHDHEHSHDHDHPHTHDHEHEPGHHHHHGPVITVIEANQRPAGKSTSD